VALEANLLAVEHSGLGGLKDGYIGSGFTKMRVELRSETH
jgi:hypothetical protein